MANTAELSDITMIQVNRCSSTSEVSDITMIQVNRFANNSKLSDTTMIQVIDLQLILSSVISPCYNLGDRADTCIYTSI